MLGRRVICTKFTTLSKVRNNSVVFESIVWDYDVCKCVMYVCVYVCVRLQTVFVVLTLCMLILETHTNTQTRICFLIGSSC